MLNVFLNMVLVSYGMVKVYAGMVNDPHDMVHIYVGMISYHIITLYVANCHVS
jgi:hypothetical protein